MVKCNRLSYWYSVFWVSSHLLSLSLSLSLYWIKFYTNIKRKGKTHRSVCDRNVADVNEIARRIPLNINSRSKSDENHSDHGRIKSEIIGVLVNKMTIM